MKLIAVGILVLSIFSCATSGKTIATTPRQTAQPVHTAGGILGFVSGALKLAVGDFTGLADRATGVAGLDSAIHKQTTMETPETQEAVEND